MSEIKTISGDIVTYGGDNSITDVKSLTVDLEPIQDLNGYSKPWVGGAGKNKADLADGTRSGQGITGTVSNQIISASGTATASYANINYFNAISITSGQTYTVMLSKSVSNAITFRFATDNTDTTYQQVTIVAGSTSATFTANNNFTVFRLYISGLTSGNTINISGLQVFVGEGNISAFEPYSNICPISGHTEVVTTRAGKNLAGDYLTCQINGSGVVSSDSFKATIFKVKSGQKYTVKGSETWAKVYAFFDHYPTIGSVSYNRSRTVISVQQSTFTAPIDGWCVFRCGALSGVYEDIVSVTQGETATDQAEATTTYTTALGRTVYGGTLNVTSGVLTDNLGYVDLGSLAWVKSSGAGGISRFRAKVVGIKQVSAGNIKVNLLSDRYEAKTANETYSGQQGISLQQNTDEIYIYDAEKKNMTATEFLNAVNGSQLVYELATPQTYQLTAQQIEALLGVNNLWSSEGEVTLSYTENVLMPESVSINGKYLEAIVDGYLTLGTSGRRSLGRELDTYSVGSADGETVKGDRFPSRKIKVNYVIQSDSEEELINSVNQLNNILNQDEADFVFRDESDKFFTGLALLDAEPKKYRHAVKGTWTLYCAYPFKRSVEPITLVSTTDASISGNSATFVFDYNGTRPARPVLRARFASAKSGGDYTEDGDCGFVAFVDGDEHIIQLGNPDVIDVDAANKNEALVNSELDAFTGWTNSGKSITSITDQFWENGKGQTQNYASGNGSIRRNIASTIGFEYDMVHRLCVSDPSQIGTFKVLLKNGNKTVVGFSIEKTGSGTGGTVKYIINDKTVGTDNVDLSYYNPHFGYCNRSPVYVAQTYWSQVVTYVKKKKKKKKKKVVSWVANTRWVQNGWSYTQSNLNSGISRDGGVVTFSVGELADRTFKSSDIDTMACTSLSIESTGSFHTNAVRSVALIQKAGVPFAEIPNVFTSGDIVEGDCNSANVYLHRKGSTIGHLEPQYGALGNDWEDFELKPGRNAIRAVWSNWVNANYKPVIEITYNEVFL